VISPNKNSNLSITQVDGHVNAGRSLNLSILLERVDAAVYSRTRGHIRVRMYTCVCSHERTPHPSQVGCRGMSSEEFSRAPLEAAVKLECAFAIADFFVRAAGDRPLRFRKIRSFPPISHPETAGASFLAARVRRETRFPDGALVGS